MPVARQMHQRPLPPIPQITPVSGERAHPWLASDRVCRRSLAAALWFCDFSCSGVYFAKLAWQVSSKLQMDIGVTRMDTILKWIDANKTWIFEGIGVAILSALASVIVLWLRRRKNEENKQVQISGDDSINIQSGRDVYIGNRTGNPHDR